MLVPVGRSGDNQVPHTSLPKSGLTIRECIFFKIETTPTNLDPTGYKGYLRGSDGCLASHEIRAHAGTKGHYSLTPGRQWQCQSALLVPRDLLGPHTVSSCVALSPPFFCQEICLKTEKESVHPKTGLNSLEKANKGIDFTTQPVTWELAAKEAIQTGIEAAANHPLVTLHSLPWSLFRV